MSIRKVIIISFILIKYCFFTLEANNQTATVSNGNVNQVLNDVKGNKNVTVNTNVKQNSTNTQESSSPSNNVQIYNRPIFTKSRYPKLLLLTANNTESKAVHQIAKKYGLCSDNKIIIDNQVVYQLGVYKGVELYQVQSSRMGMINPGSSIYTLTSLIPHLKPKYIIAVGIAFGNKNKDNQRLGDILVSEQICSYSVVKETNTTKFYRSDKGSTTLNNIVNAGINSWSGATIHKGLIMSGDKLINSKDMLLELFRQEPEYIGGDMESYGLYSVASSKKIDWLMVKGISDWADGSKNDKYHKIAATNAAKFIFHLLDKEFLS